MINHIDFEKTVYNWCIKNNRLDLLDEWSKRNEKSPKEVTVGTSKKYLWDCFKCNCDYLMSPYNRIIQKSKCPICSNRKVVKGINDFKTCNPKLMLDWDYEKNKNIDPEALSKKSITRADWKCHICGFEWNGTIRDAVEKDINCPKCSQKEKAWNRHLYELKKNGCLKDKKLLLDWDYEKNKISPSEVTPFTKTPVYWKCHICGYRWEARINNRANGKGCPCCSNHVVVPGINDLATTHPQLAKEWHPIKNDPLTPAQVTYGMSRKIWWVCPNGHEYLASILHRGSGLGTNCPICNSGRQTSFREQAFYYYIKKMYPKTISRYKPKDFGQFELDIFIPEINTAIEYDGVAWHKHDKLEREQRKYSLCKEKGIKLIRVREEMPENPFVGIADELITTDNINTEVGLTNMIHMILGMICIAGGYWIHPYDINLYRDKFEILKYATEIKNSFADKYPEIAKEWHPTKNGTLKPTMFKSKSEFKFWWLCPKCGYEWETTLAHRSAGTGCPNCYALNRKKR